VEMACAIDGQSDVDLSAHAATGRS